MYEAVTNSAEVVAAVLGIAVTVVAIIVELAATRYNHRISTLFIREPLNIATLSFFVLTVLLCVWVAAVSDAEGHSLLHGATMVMITLALLALLPYFGYVFAFISPINMIRHITHNGLKELELATTAASVAEHRKQAANAVDELQDVLRSAIDGNDRDIAMSCVEAQIQLLSAAAERRQQLPAGWRDEAQLDIDPDFVSLEPVALAKISSEGTWFEYKVVSHLHTAVGLCLPQLRDVANLISIRTRQVALKTSPPVRDLCLVSFNSYLRVSINARDPRSAYYILSQYRIVAEELMQRGEDEDVDDIIKRLQFYGQLGFQLGQPFILEVCAFDIVQLLERAIECSSQLRDSLLDALLELDREVLSETQEVSLAGVRRAQIRAAAALLVAGDEARAEKVIDDLRSEKQIRIQRLINELEAETESEFWELTPRGVNFAYLEQMAREALPDIRQRLDG